MYVNGVVSVSAVENSSHWNQLAKSFYREKCAGVAQVHDLYICADGHDRDRA
jgi:hypothetical protein